MELSYINNLAASIIHLHLSDFLFTRYNNRNPALSLLLEYDLADGQQQEELHPETLYQTTLR